jgi:hypothetical protein
MLISEVNRFRLNFSDGGRAGKARGEPGFLTCDFDGVLCQFRYTTEQYAWMSATQPDAPVSIGWYGRSYWWFRGTVYWTDVIELTSKQAHDLIVAREIEQERAIQRQIDRAQAIVAQSENPTPRRESISVEVRKLVWQRDGGKCVQCDSSVELQFDHIIPIKLGGAGTPENLQVLCGPCNRRKGATLG